MAGFCATTADDLNSRRTPETRGEGRLGTVRTAAVSIRMSVYDEEKYITLSLHYVYGTYGISLLILLS